MKYDDLCIKGTDTVRCTLKQLDNTAKGIVFIVDENKKLLGTLTDGDVRRHLLAGGGLEDEVGPIACSHPRVATDIKFAESLYDARSYYAIPIVDEKGILVDVYFGKNREEKRTYAEISVPVVINAGGKGTRLDPFTKVLPKPLIPVGDYPIIDHIMREFSQYACDDFHIIVNYKKQLMKAYFADNDNLYDITWYDEEKPLGTGGGLSLLRGKIKKTFFFTSCDTLLKTDYEGMVRFHRENKNDVTMICAYKTLSVPYGVIEMGVNGSIDALKEKPEFSFLTNTGVYILEPSVFDYIEDNESIGFPDVIEKMRAAGCKVAAYPVRESEWYDMGEIPELERMRESLFAD